MFETMMAHGRGDTLKGVPHTALRYSAVPAGAHASACRPRSDSLAGVFALVCVLSASPLHAQGGDPLRKTDLVRLLTGNTSTLPQIVGMVRRSCVSFTPTARDRQNLLALGGDSTLLKAIDECVRTRAVPAAVATKPAPVRPKPAARVDTAPSPPVIPRLLAVPLNSRVSAPAGGSASVGVALKRGTEAVSGTRLALRGSARLSGGDADAQAVTDELGIAQFRFMVTAAPGTTRLSIAIMGGDTLDAPAGLDFTVVAPTAPDRPTAPSASTARPPGGQGLPSAERTGFVSGAGQHGRVGEAAAQPVVFEVKDGDGKSLAGVGVSFTITNGQLLGTASNLTDSLGQARVRVQFGERAGVPTVVTGTIGGIARDATLYAAPGAATRLVVLLGGNTLIGEMVLLVGRPSELRIYGRDRFGNSAPLAGLRATSGDEKVVRVTEVTSDSGGGSVTLTAGRGGSTSIVIEGSSLRADFSAQVHP